MGIMVYFLIMGNAGFCQQEGGRGLRFGCRVWSSGFLGVWI